jgi:hypothetical protein
MSRRPFQIGFYSVRSDEHCTYIMCLVLS